MSIEYFLSQHDVLIDEAELEFLERIETPKDLRGFNEVDKALREMSDIYPELFFDTFSLSREQYIGLSSKIKCSPVVNTKPFYSKSSSSKDSWKSTIPIYVLLFEYQKYVDNNNRSEYSLRFLNHYWKHYDVLDEMGIRKDSAEKFRLLCKNTKFDTSMLCNASNSEAVGDLLRKYIDKLQNGNKKKSHSKVINYSRVLSNFYLLSIHSRSRLSIGGDRYEGRYSYKNMERAGASDEFDICIPEFKKTSGEIDSSEEYGVTRSAMLVPSSLKNLSYEYRSRGSLNKHRIRTDSVNITSKLERAHNHSILARSVIQLHELDTLLLKLRNDLNDEQRIEGVPKKYLAKICVLKLFGGFSNDDISNINVIGEGDSDGVGFLSHRRSWLFRWTHTRTIQAETSDQDNLNDKLGNVIAIGLPEFVVNALDLDSISTTTKWMSGGVTQKLNSLLPRYLKRLPVSITQVENFVANFNEAYGLVDPVVFDFAFNRVSYRVRAKRHYIDYSAVELSSQIEKFWQHISQKLASHGFDCADFIEATIKNKGSEYQKVGSHFMPSLDQLQLNKSILQSKLKGYQNQVCREIHTLVDYHNRYTAYVSHMLIQGSGYRAVYSPLPSFSLLNERHKVLYISDKDSNITFHHSRVISLPDVVIEQLKLYKKHLVVMANFLSLKFPHMSEKIWYQLDENSFPNLGSEPDVINWFKKIKNSRGDDGCLFYIEVKAHIIRIKNVSPKWLNEPDFGAELSVRVQSYRHFVRGHLTKNTNLPDEIISFQMGHGAAGEMPLSASSSSSYLKSTNLIREQLNVMMKAIGWSVLPSVLCSNRGAK